jgi:hypothetical protein
VGEAFGAVLRHQLSIQRETHLVAIGDPDEFVIEAMILIGSLF